MNKYTVVHIMVNDKFIKPFIEFIEDNFESDKHIFLYFGGRPFEEYPLPKVGNIVVLNEHISKYKKVLFLLKYFFIADKIILHGLFNFQVVKVLYIFPWFLKKCYWIVWGGDLYFHISARDHKDYIRAERYRKKVIQNLEGVICYNQAEFDLVNKWYGTKAKFFKSFFYPSNLYEELTIVEDKSSTIYIQVGNSADPTNNHVEVFKKLEAYKNENIKIIVPLSYGSKEYAKKVIKIGKKIFGDKFEPLIDFMPFDKYLNILGKIDIAIFNHNRQQAMGNITTLLGLGKKVYMKRTITPWKLFKEIDIKVFDVEQIDLTLLDDDIKKHNIKKVKNYFSKENLVKEWKEILEFKKM